MAVNLYVGNLPFTTTDEELREAFAAFGTVAEGPGDDGPGRPAGLAGSGSWR